MGLNNTIKFDKGRIALSQLLIASWHNTLSLSWVYSKKLCGWLLNYFKYSQHCMYFSIAPSVAFLSWCLLFCFVLMKQLESLTAKEGMRPLEFMCVCAHGEWAVLSRTRTLISTHSINSRSHFHSSQNNMTAEDASIFFFPVSFTLSISLFVSLSLQLSQCLSFSIFSQNGAEKFLLMHSGNISDFHFITL